jgi:transposase
MSLKARTVCPVPQETARVARAAYPRGNLYMQMRDVLGCIYADEDFAALFPKEGQPALAPWRLALITVLQFVENLSDQQATDAVRGRIDWKYLLGLSLTDSGFDASVLSEFRARLVEHHAEHLLLEKMLTLFGQKGWLKARGRQRTDSTHVLAKIRALNRVLCVWETSVQRSIVWPSSRQTGYGLTAILNGWNAMALAAKIRARLWGKQSAWLLPKRSDSREESCWMLSLIQLHLSGSVRFLQQKSYGKCGYKIISGSTITSGGVLLRIFLLPLATSVLLMTKELPMASLSADRLRYQPLSHRLGKATGHLPAGTHQHQLDSGY